MAEVEVRWLARRESRVASSDRSTATATAREIKESTADTPESPPPPSLTTQPSTHSAARPARPLAQMTKAQCNANIDVCECVCVCVLRFCDDVEGGEGVGVVAGGGRQRAGAVAPIWSM